MADSKRPDDWNNKAKADVKGAKILFDHDGGSVLILQTRLLHVLVKNNIAKR